MAMPPLKVIKIIVEGNIGAGKTTILEKFKEESQHWLNESFPDFSNQIETVIWTEPIESWTNDQGRNLLDEYYTKPGKSAKLFQTLIQLQYFQRTASLKDIQRSGNIKILIVIMERSIYSGNFVFLQVAKERGLIKPYDYQELNDTFDIMCQGNRFWSPFDGIIYISTDSGICWERVKIRGRPAETRRSSFLSQSYLEEIHQKYMCWLNNWKSKQNARESPVKTIIIQETQDPADHYEKFKKNILEIAACAISQFNLYNN